MKQKIKVYLLLTCVTICWNDLAGQNNDIHLKTSCPKEKFEIILSQESVFTNEIVWFKIYCVSSLFPEKEISSIAFIELVSSENTSIIRKKILLKQGEGLGEFEIPDNLPTGLYYILAYTNWMKNFGETSFCRKELIIVNPDQPLINTRDSLDYSESKTQIVETPANVNKLKISSDKTKYSAREKVTIKINTRGLTGKSISGNFSVSVSRKEPDMIFNAGKSNEFAVVKDPEKIVYMPDYEGIRLSGKLQDPAGNAVPGAFVTASVPGPGTDIKSNITDSKGVFNFILKPKEGEQDIVITLPDQETRISLEESFWNGFRNPPDNRLFQLKKDAVAYLQEKYVHFQLQNRFKKQYSLRISPFKGMADSSVFYTKPYQLLELSKYISLDSLREYFYELVPSVKFTQRRGESDISVIDPLTLSPLENKPGVFLDGVLYDNYAGIANISVGEIDRLAVLPNTYYYKDFTFGGIIDIHTKKSDFNSVKALPNMTRFIYPMANQSEWRFSPPDYSVTDSLNRIPDFRYLLLWEPKVRIDNSGEVAIHFYAGDVNGSFVVTIVGITDDGELLNAKSDIYIED
jgi:hypothetical protein